MRVYGVLMSKGNEWFSGLLWTNNREGLLPPCIYTFLFDRTTKPLSP